MVSCMQGPMLAQRQEFRAIPVQIQANAILSMNVLELQQFLQAEAMENPAMKVEESSRCPVCGFLNRGTACPVCGAAMKKREEPGAESMGERDYLERVFVAVDDEADFDPFRTVAAATDLNEHLRQQARMALGGRQLRIAEYLIDCLDEDGYFRESLYDVAEVFAAAVPEIEAVLSIVQSFDPPGIGARDLQECLILQLRALGADDAAASNAERILLDHWNDFSKLRLKPIAKEMDVNLAVVQEACAFIKDRLTPHPASLYRAPFGDLSPRDSAAIVPDVVVRRKGESVVADVLDYSTGLLTIDETYDELYQSAKTGESPLSDEDRKHIKEHVERVKCILEAIGLRKKTLARVAIYLAEHQSEFIMHGPSHLKPLRQKDVAKALEVHESTICRAISNKYCKLPSGEVISFDVFFDAALPIRHMITKLVAVSTKPLSDSEIARKLADEGVVVARRTVAKYREQLKMLPYQLRAA